MCVEYEVVQNYLDIFFIFLGGNGGISKGGMHAFMYLLSYMHDTLLTLLLRKAEISA